MKVKDAITELWKQDFFADYKQVKEIDTSMKAKFGVTCANTTVMLNSCRDFLRKDTEGWIQRMPAQEKMKHSTSSEEKNLHLHQEIEKVSKRLFDDGHYAQSIFEAFKHVNNLVKHKSGAAELDGKSLMLTAFSVKQPLLKLNKLQTMSEKDEQEGFMHLFAGAIQGIRNPKGHETIVQNDKERAIHYLIFASLLCHKLDEASKT